MSFFSNLSRRFTKRGHTDTHTQTSNHNIPEVTYLSFSQDYTHLAIGTEIGYLIYQCSPFELVSYCECGYIYMIEMSYASNLIALVGDLDINSECTRALNSARAYTETLHLVPINDNVCTQTSDTHDAVKETVLDTPTGSRHVAHAHTPPHTNTSPVHDQYTDTNAETLIADNQILVFANHIISLKFSRSHIIVMLPTQIRVYNTFTLVCVFVQDIVCTALCGCCNNEIFALSREEDVGAIHILDISHNQVESKRKRAHDNAIQTMTFNTDASLIASASVKGTLVRVWNVEHMTLHALFRRGNFNAAIYHLSFSYDDWFLCCSTNTEFLVFKIEKVAVSKHNIPQEPMHHLIRPRSDGSVSAGIRKINEYAKTLNNRFWNLTTVPGYFAHGDLLLTESTDNSLQAIAFARSLDDGERCEVFVASSNRCAYVYESTATPENVCELKKEFVCRFPS